MFRLDYLSCLLTILSTFLVGRKLWFGLALAGVNSVIVCVIGVETSQFGFIPANLFCIGVYACSIRSWRKEGTHEVRTSELKPQLAVSTSRNVEASASLRLTA